MTKAEDSIYIIAEAGVNHNGDIQRALEMIDAAAEAGADCVKFQTFIPEALASQHAEKASYQQKNANSQESQLQMLKQLALPLEQFQTLQEQCDRKGIDFLSSPFDRQSADFLINQSRLKTIKLGSGELTNAPLLWQIADSGVDLILSTGMASKDEINQALSVLSLGYQNITPDAHSCFDSFDLDILKNKVSLLHCTTAYPCPDDQVDLRAMQTLAEWSQLPTGFSDHTQGTAIAIAAVARGASILEKHFTLDKNLAGPDHQASLEPDELSKLVKACQRVTQALGKAEKSIGTEERENAQVARKGLVASKKIAKGELFSTDNLTSKRPQAGLAPANYWRLLGTPAKQDYDADQPIKQTIE